MSKEGRFLTATVAFLLSLASPMAHAQSNDKSGILFKTKFSGLPVLKLSIPRTLSPRRTNSRAMDEPMNPAIPVIR